MDCSFQSDPGGVGPAASVHNRLLSAPTRRLCRPLSLISDYCCSDPQHASYCTHMVGVWLPKASLVGDLLSSPYPCFLQYELIILLVFPVLTNCASLHMTHMKRYTGCYSWPSVRVVRALACSDHSCLAPTVSRASGHKHNH